MYYTIYYTIYYTVYYTIYYTIYYTLLYSTILYSTLLYSTLLYSTILYYTIHYTIYYILYTIYHIPYTIYYILYTIYYILYTIYYILYTIYYTALSSSVCSPFLYRQHIFVLGVLPSVAVCGSGFRALGKITAFRFASFDAVAEFLGPKQAKLLVMVGLYIQICCRGSLRHLDHENTAFGIQYLVSETVWIATHIVHARSPCKRKSGAALMRFGVQCFKYFRG